ncbi:MAG: hypothetical protein LBF69_05300 [Prevotellaceae bacterium]|jgi:hypothetical protein|nr:hypothetical protein [Prevotellaceae bacterium]
MVDKIKYDERNYRKHDERNKALIKKSLEECGAGRSIVTDKDNVIVAGNGVYEQAQALGLKARIIESDGKELIVIKRTDLSTTDEKRKLLAMADNRTSDTSEFDFDLLTADFDIDLLNDWDFKSFELGISADNNPDDEFNKFGEFEYANRDVEAYRSIILHFDSEDDVKNFAEITQLPIKDKTRAIYFPHKENERFKEVYE